MDIELFEIIIRKIAQTKPVNQIFLTGNGEPLLHPQLEEFISLTHKYNLYPSFTSNGLLLDGDRIKSLTAAGDFSITVDFSPHKELYEKNRVGGNWDKVYQNLKNFLQYKKKSNHQNIKVTVKDMSTILLKDGKSKMDSLLELKELFLDLPVDNFAQVAFHNWIGNINQEVILDVGSTEGYTLCSHPWSLMQINFKGQIVACCRDMTSKYIVGKIDDKSDIMELWNNKKMIELRKALIEKRTSDIATCRNCDRPKRGGSIGRGKFEMLKNFLTKRKGFTRTEF